MPLIIFTGFPSLGKTRSAIKLRNFFEDKINLLNSNELNEKFTLTYCSDNELISLTSNYKNSKSEKILREKQISIIKNKISKTNFVILDSLAYIKGFRYQLYCESKNAQTSHCVIYMINSKENCVKWNENRKLDERWNSELLHEICYRYEEPNSNNKWDSPLITVDSEQGISVEQLEEIWGIIHKKKKIIQNACSIKPMNISHNYLQNLNKITQDTVNNILESQQIDNFNVDNFKTIMKVSESSNLAQIQKIRKSFISLNRTRVIPESNIQSIFIDFLKKNLNS